jgi:ATP-binding cassette subfamily C protein
MMSKQVTKPEPQTLDQARKQSRRLLFSSVAFSIVVNLLMLTGPLFMLQVYDRVLASRSEETLLALFLLVAGLYFLMGVIDYSRGRVMARIGSRLQVAFDKRIFAALLDRSSDSKANGDDLTVLRDIEAVQGFYSSQVSTAVLDVPWTPLFLAMIFVFHPTLGWLAVGGGAFLISLTLLNQILTAKKVSESQIGTEVSHRFSAEIQQGRDVVASQGMQLAVVERWSEKRTDALAKKLHAADLTGTFTSMIKASRLFLQSSMLALGAYLVLLGEITGGAMIASSIVLGRALAPVEQLMGQWQSLQRARSGWKALKRFLAATPIATSPTSLPRPIADLAVSGLVVVPPDGQIATLKNINFELKPGQALAVIGRSGSGKSSLAKALLGLWKPAAGSVRIGGATLDQYSAQDQGEYIGYLPQNVTLFSGTVSENISRLATAPNDEAIVQAAKHANAHEMIMGLANGYDTFVSGNGSMLSGGQKQRIALARALYSDPEILVLDEPNSALDAEGSAALNRTVRLFKQAGKAIVLMTHRPNAIVECDMVLILDQGTQTAFGSRDEVLKAHLANAAEIGKPRKKVNSGVTTS